jgi:hypothetical protein
MTSQTELPETPLSFTRGHVENLSQKVAGLEADESAEDTKERSPDEVPLDEATDTKGADRVATAAAATATSAAPETFQIGWINFDAN